MGEHGNHQVLLFSSIRVDGQPVSVSGDVKRHIRGQVPGILASYESLRTGRTTGWTSAVGLAAMVSAIAGDTGEVFPGSAVLAGEYGCRGLRSEEHTSELQSHSFISYAVFCLKKKKTE